MILSALTFALVFTICCLKSGPFSIVVSRCIELKKIKIMYHVKARSLVRSADSDTVST